LKAQALAFVARRRAANGGYGWNPGDPPHISPTFAAVGCYRLLNEPMPEPRQVGAFLREHYPVPNGRRTDRPLWRFDFEQAQSLLWLGEPVNSFRALAEKWTKPAEFTKTYELGGNPVFQHQAMAVCVRKLTGIDQGGAGGDAWRRYFSERRRPNGTFNNTPASDGSGGHILNTVWGMWAEEALGEKTAVSGSLAAWIRDCQLPSGGFTFAPEVNLGGVDDVIYSWAALWLLDKAGEPPRRKSALLAWLSSLAAEGGGYQDRPGGLPNLTATYYALECFQLLRQPPAAAGRPAPAAPRPAIPAGARVFTIQVEAPGVGSPSEAVVLAEKLGIHIWAAKNSAPGWIAEAQRIADVRKVPVTFAIGNEEYGTYTSVPGLGAYSHLVDLVAPPDRDFGAQLPKKNFAYPWEEFRDTRIRQLRAGRGRMIWQFNENEEITRALLDEAAQKGTYSAISTFHFGLENFLESQPFLQRWLGRIPMVALQDAHGGESWWWGDWLTGFRTLFIAREPTWDGWLEALDRNHVASARRDAVTKWELQIAGALPHVRDFLMAHSSQWAWWDEQEEARGRPAGVMTVLRPGSPFEAGAPERGLAVRIRLWADNTGQGVPRTPRAELAALEVDGREVIPNAVSAQNDRYLIYAIPDAAARRATARVRALETGKETILPKSASRTIRNKAATRKVRERFPELFPTAI
jgi:hypothetical protein